MLWIYLKLCPALKSWVTWIFINRWYIIASPQQLHYQLPCYVKKKYLKLLEGNADELWLLDETHHQIFLVLKTSKKIQKHMNKEYNGSPVQSMSLLHFLYHCILLTWTLFLLFWFVFQTKISKKWTKIEIVQSFSPLLAYEFGGA